MPLWTGCTKLNRKNKVNKNRSLSDNCVLELNRDLDIVKAFNLRVGCLLI